MNPPSPSAARTSSARATVLIAAGLVGAVGLAWSNSLEGPFVLDDFGNLAENLSIRHLADLGTVLHPPASAGVGGRPLLNLTFALNYAWTGLDLRALHLTNLGLHALAALTLFALLRHTLLVFTPADWPRPAALPIAALAAALWALHPVHTQAVTYLSQRAEVLAGWFYLLTLTCAARYLSASLAADAPPGRRTVWAVAAVVACTLGVASKEIVGTAPLLVLLYDRCFVSGSVRAALRQHARLYLALAATWILLAVLLADVGSRGIGGDHGVSSWTYALTSSRTLWLYLRLCVWPHPLIFDYGMDYITMPGPAVPYLLALFLLLGGVGLTLWRRPRLGFAPAAFFLLLAPTTSVVPIAFSPVAESRLYLPLAAVTTLLSLAAFRVLRARAVWWLLPLALLGGALTFARNRTYATDLALWTDTAARRPQNPAAHYNLGLMQSRAGQLEAAVASWRTTLAVDPTFAAAHNNLANTLATLGQIADSVPHYEAALRLQPFAPLVRSNFSVILLQLGRLPEAEAQIRLSLRQFPDSAAARYNLGLVLEACGQLDEEIAAYEAALRLEPLFVNAHHNLALALARANRLDEARRHLETVIRLRPDRVEPRLTLTRVLLNSGQSAAARDHALTTLQGFPASPDAHLLLGNCLTYLGDFPAAVAAFERALALRPDFPAARANLEKVRPLLPKN